jgi:hypothetical protein
LCDSEEDEEVNRREIHRSYGLGLHVPLSCPFFIILSFSLSPIHGFGGNIQRNKEKEGRSSAMYIYLFLFKERVWAEG